MFSRAKLDLSRPVLNGLGGLDLRGVRAGWSAQTGNCSLDPVAHEPQPVHGGAPHPRLCQVSGKRRLELDPSWYEYVCPSNPDKI